MRTERFLRTTPHTHRGTDGISRSYNIDVLCIRLYCDCCSNTFEYEGSERIILVKAQSANWKMGPTGIVRCPDCTRKAGRVLESAIGRIFA